MWEIEKAVKKGDYIYAVVREHPGSTKFGYVLEHRIVMENSLNRLLGENEVVHHINGNKKDNRIENLEILDHREHVRIHVMDRGRKCVDLICPNCSIAFTRRYKDTHLAKEKTSTFCSHKCSSKFHREKQLRGETSQMKNAISRNVILVYRLYPDGSRLEEEAV